MMRRDVILVTGATGYVGGRLVPILLERDYPVRCLVRDPSRIEGRDWTGVESVAGDVLDYDSLLPAMANVRVAYYLVHSMAAGPGFHERDLQAARNFGRAAKASGVERIIYLGGLGVDNPHLSAHLKSRQQTGDSLRESGVPVTEFRAAQVIGAGSASFELIRNAVERLPVMPMPKSVCTRSQPIGIRDVLRYLADCLEIPLSAGQIIQIGGREILSYREMILTYAEIRGLKRAVIEVPFLTPRLVAFFLDLITPVPANIILALISGLDCEVVVQDNLAARLFPFTPMAYGEAVRLALKRIESGQVKTTWFDAFSSFGDVVPQPVKLTSSQGLLIEKRQMLVNADLFTTYKVITCFGGDEGWLYADSLWRLRGLLDRLTGGVGMRRGRRCPTQLRAGDSLGFWRVEAMEENRLLRLHAEFKMRSNGWLQFETVQKENQQVLVTQTAFFEPKGLLGVLYWYLLYPVHKFLFGGMIQNIKAHAEQFSRDQQSKSTPENMPVQDK